MRRLLVLAWSSLLFLALPALTQERAATLDGFSPEGARRAAMGRKIPRDSISGKYAQGHAAA